MANVLYLESDPIAVKAFKGLIHRSPHSLTHVQNPDEAWNEITQGKFFHILVTEVKLEGSSSKVLLSRLRAHAFLRRMPVLVYAKANDRDIVRQMLLHDIQNYLIKPYEDDKLYAEINKSVAFLWWKRCFEEAPRVCLRLGIQPEELVKRLSRLLLDARRFIQKIDPRLLESSFQKEHAQQLTELSKRARDLGFIPMATSLTDVISCVEKHNWREATEKFDALAFGGRLIEEHLKPGSHSLPEGSDEALHLAERQKSMRSVERVATWHEVKERLQRLSGYPVIESVGASFLMAARDQDIDVRILVNMIETDPCLTTQVLYYSNVTSKSAKTQIEDPKQAIALLGLTRMRKMAQEFLTIPDEHFTFRSFDWKSYWMFQLATAMLSEEIVKILSLPLNPNMAYYGGLLHETGKLLLCYLYPEAYANAVEYAWDTGIPLLDTEKHYFGCDHEQVGLFFAQTSLMPPQIQSTIGACRLPETAAPEHREVVAIVSLADYLCKTHEVGFSGSRIARSAGTFAQHPSWEILKPLLYHGFTVAKFERLIEERVKILKRELLGLAERKQR